MSNHKICPICQDRRILIPKNEPMCMTCARKARANGK
jgi:hypothetical protein